MKKLTSLFLILLFMLSSVGCEQNKEIPSSESSNRTEEINTTDENPPAPANDTESSEPIKNETVNNKAGNSETDIVEAVDRAQNIPNEEPKENLDSVKTSVVLPLEVEKTWWQKGLAKEQLVIDEDFANKYSYFYLYDDMKKLSYECYEDIYSISGNEDVGLILNTSSETDDIGEPILSDYFFEIVALDDTKYTILFYEKGINLTRSIPGEGKGDSVNLLIDEADYKKILENIEEEISNRKDFSGKVAWLSMMRRSRITDITITSSDGEHSESYGGFDDYLYEDINSLVSNMRETDKRELPNSANVKIKFNNGLIFDVYVNEENLLIYANDVDMGLLYDEKFDSHKDTLDDYAQGKENAVTGKPIIYLYPEQKTDCTVKVGYPRFTYTYPAYNDGWNVTAYPDGKIINKADGSEYYYLFWEGDKRVKWDYSEGFVVKGSDSERFLKEKLAYMGLTPREYNDFITYWVPRLKDAPYNLITFAGEQYEELAPLTVTPSPDSILRIHMVFKTIDKPIEIKEQTLERFQRSGFTVVEWGGTIDN